MASVNPFLSQISSQINAILPQSASGQNRFLSDGSTTEDLNQATGDSIVFSPDVQTAHSGKQAETQITIGPEALSKFSNGAAVVSDSHTGKEISDENGHLYAVQLGTSKRTDLGADTSSSAIHAAEKALGGGQTGASETKDLLATASGSLGSAPTVQSHASEFGVNGQDGVDSLNSVLTLASQAEREGPESSDLQKLLGMITQQAQSSQKSHSSTDSSVTS